MARVSGREPLKTMKYTLVATLILMISVSCSTDKTKDDMGLFDHLKKEKIEKTHELMDEDRFWSLIEKSKQSSEDLEDFAENLTTELKQMTSTDIIGFHLREQKLRFDSYTSELWCAGYIMNGGCSDDSFEYFRCWIIAQGKDAYYSSLKIRIGWLIFIQMKLKYMILKTSCTLHRMHLSKKQKRI